MAFDEYFTVTLKENPDAPIPKISALEDFLSLDENMRSFTNFGHRDGENSWSHIDIYATREKGVYELMIRWGHSGDPVDDILKELSPRFEVYKRD